MPRSAPAPKPMNAWRTWNIALNVMNERPKTQPCLEQQGAAPPAHKALLGTEHTERLPRAALAVIAPHSRLYSAIQQWTSLRLACKTKPQAQQVVIQKPRWWENSAGVKGISSKAAGQPTGRDGTKQNGFIWELHILRRTAQTPEANIISTQPMLLRSTRNMRSAITTGHTLTWQLMRVGECSNCSGLKVLHTRTDPPHRRLGRRCSSTAAASKRGGQISQSINQSMYRTGSRTARLRDRRGVHRGWERVDTRQEGKRAAAAGAHRTALHRTGPSLLAQAPAVLSGVCTLQRAGQRGVSACAPAACERYVRPFCHRRCTQ